MPVKIVTETVLVTRDLEAGDQVKLTFEGGQELLLTGAAWWHRSIGRAEVFLCFDPMDALLSESFVRSLPPPGHRWGGEPSEWGLLALWSPARTGVGVNFKRFQTVSYLNVTVDSLVSLSTPPVTAIEVP